MKIVDAAPWVRSITLFSLVGLAAATFWPAWSRYHRVFQENQKVRNEIAQLTELTRQANQAAQMEEQSILLKMKRGIPIRATYDSPLRSLALTDRVYPLLVDQLADQRHAVSMSAQLNILRLDLRDSDKEAFIQMLIDRLGEPENSGPLVNVLLRLEVDQVRLSHALVAAIDQDKFDNLEDLAHHIYLFHVRPDAALVPMYLDLMRRREATENEVVRNALRQRYFEKEQMLDALNIAIDSCRRPTENERLCEWREIVQNVEAPSSRR